MDTENRPKVGIAVVIFKDGKILLTKRKGSHGGGEYAFPGGHLEYMESIADCAKRETAEEAGIEVDNIKFLRLCNLKEYAPKHYIDIAVTADWKSGEPRIMEPEKSEGWDWYDIENLPRPIFKSIDTIVEALKTGRNYFDK